MILASASPRRLELLQKAGFQLSVMPADIDEQRLDGETPIALVQRLATAKAHASLKLAGALPAGEVLLAADTIVWTGDDVLGKPHDAGDACRMLAELSERTHHVSTGVCLLVGAPDAPAGIQERSFVETTSVSFREVTSAEIASYVATGEPMDKAGAYAIQGGAHAFVSSFEGDYDNVVGLPVTRVLTELESMGISVNPVTKEVHS
ncbi:MAG: Maf family protein [Coriobacteriales bacterium]|nr:Maf family protein [Coriobacteriales bacterium]